MNLFEFAEKFNISLSKARAMQKADVLRLDEVVSEEAAEIRALLIKGQPLTAALLCWLVDNPAQVWELGRYTGKAQEQLETLGNVKAQAAPKEIAANISDAARGDSEAVALLVSWLKEIIPARDVPHSFIAVRLLLGLAPGVRRFDVPRIPRALLQCRRCEDFAGWWIIHTHGTRSQTFYKRPAKKPLATFDL